LQKIPQFYSSQLPTSLISRTHQLSAKKYEGDPGQSSETYIFHIPHTSSFAVRALAPLRSLWKWHKRTVTGMQHIKQDLKWQHRRPCHLRVSSITNCSYVYCSNCSAVHCFTSIYSFVICLIYLYNIFNSLLFTDCTVYRSIDHQFPGRKYLASMRVFHALILHTRQS
jgi:hypothetical protein